MSHSSNASIHFLSLHLAVYVEKAAHLLNNGKCEREMLFFSERYELALLKIEVESTIEVKPPHDGSRPRYNEKVSILSRDKNLSLRLRHGTIKWDEQGFFFFVKCKYCPVIIISVCSFHVFWFHYLLTMWCFLGAVWPRWAGA